MSCPCMAEAHERVGDAGVDPGLQDGPLLRAVCTGRAGHGVYAGRWVLRVRLVAIGSVSALLIRGPCRWVLLAAVGGLAMVGTLRRLRLGFWVERSGEHR